MISDAQITREISNLFTKMAAEWACDYPKTTYNNIKQLLPSGCKSSIAKVSSRVRSDKWPQSGNIYDFPLFQFSLIALWMTCYIMFCRLQCRLPPLLILFHAELFLKIHPAIDQNLLMCYYGMAHAWMSKAETTNQCWVAGLKYFAPGSRTQQRPRMDHTNLQSTHYQTLGSKFSNPTSQIASNFQQVQHEKPWAVYHDLHSGLLGLNEWQPKWSPKIDEKMQQTCSYAHNKINDKTRTFRNLQD